MPSEIPAKYLELNVFLKIKKLAPTGGQAKPIIKEGAVKVNGILETRNKRKLYAGDLVECFGNNYLVEKELLK